MKRNYKLPFVISYLNATANTEVSVINGQFRNGDSADQYSSYGPGCKSEYLHFDSVQDRKVSVFSETTRQGLRPIQPPIQCVPAASSLGLIRPGRESNHSLLVQSLRMYGVITLHSHTPSQRVQGFVTFSDIVQCEVICQLSSSAFSQRDVLLASSRCTIRSYFKHAGPLLSTLIQIFATSLDPQIPLSTYWIVTRPMQFSSFMLITGEMPRRERHPIFFIFILVGSGNLLQISAKVLLQ